MPEYIPNTIVRLLENVPFDSTYSDTILFTSVAEQTNFMQGKAKYSFNNFTYQRVNSSVAAPRIAYSIRVPRVADDLYNCNYLMFQNSNYGSKWFYAFIKQVNYINPNNTEIIYEIDVYQTWAFNFEILPSIVEREHSLTDEPFENLTPEPLKPETYVTSNLSFNTWKHLNESVFYVMLVTYSEKLPDGFLEAGNFGGVYSGLWMTSASNPDTITGLIKQFETLGISNSIVAIFMTPVNPLYPIDETNLSTGITKETSSLDTHIIRNKKLMNYPYRIIRLHSSSGQNVDLRPEFIRDDTLTVNIRGVGGASPSALCSPNVKELSEYENSVSYDAIVQCAWSSNVYANWQAQNMASNSIKVIGGLLQTVLGIGMASAGMPIGLGTAISGVTSLVKFNAESYDIQQKPNIPNGTPFAESLTIGLKRTGFSAYALMIDTKTAERYDDFFDMYGYACNKLKKPNLAGRESWNYVKTNNVILKGSMPVDAMDRIKQMFNNGIRFWHGDFVGDYARSNKPLSEVI